MQKYKCHKIVEAFKITCVESTQFMRDMWKATGVDQYAVLHGEGGEHVQVGKDYCARCKPADKDGYYVKYKDGYESFSPAKEFEAGYTKLTQDGCGWEKAWLKSHPSLTSDDMVVTVGGKVVGTLTGTEFTENAKIKDGGAFRNMSPADLWCGGDNPCAKVSGSLSFKFDESWDALLQTFTTTPTEVPESAAEINRLRKFNSSLTIINKNHRSALKEKNLQIERQRKLNSSLTIINKNHRSALKEKNLQIERQRKLNSSLTIINKNHRSALKEKNLQIERQDQNMNDVLFAHNTRVETLKKLIEAPTIVKSDQPTENTCRDMLSMLKSRAYKTAASKGFHRDAINHGEAMALIHSEVSEALEVLRLREMPDSTKISGFTEIEEEMADVIIRVLDYSGLTGLDIGGAVLSKMDYNARRESKHGKKF